MLSEHELLMGAHVAGALLAHGERVVDAEVNDYWSASGAMFTPNSS